MDKVCLTNFQDWAMDNTSEVICAVADEFDDIIQNAEDLLRKIEANKHAAILTAITARRIRTLAKEQEPSGSWRRMIKTVSAYKKLMPDEMTVLIALQSDRDETRAKRDRDPHIVLLRSIYKAKMDEKPRNGQLDAMPPAEKCWFKPYIDDDVKHSSPFNEDDEVAVMSSFIYAKKNQFA
ncbi:uncharacterized protein LOC129580687 isoform X4 [Paramacrobiotus metropolitanus]|uniref:uncharacterized protein LOC129580687 isoform X4 n=1 Tax=Paramacrobiotus metropolitanus TaxID=2943436 RepID=UPI002445C9FB|nr:uncharacterized protein LOC129580687 isoform X4 [Paramacrobiotus metropolitanus]